MVFKLGDDGPKETDFELLFNSLPGLYLVLSPELNIVAASDRYLDATMTEREIILGRNIFDVFPDDQHSEATGVRNLRASLEYVLQNRVPDTMAVQRYPIRVGDASDVTFEVRYWSPTNSPVLTPSGDQLKFIIHRVEDVTEYVRSLAQGTETQSTEQLLDASSHRINAEIYARAQEIQEANRRLKLAHAELSRLNNLLEERAVEREAALDSSNERFRLLVDGVREYAIFMLDPRGVITSWNQGAERIYRYRENQIVGQAFACFFSAADRLAGIPEKELATAIEHGSADEQGWRIRQDGSKFWSIGVLTALYDSQGAVRGFAKIARDMTKSRQAEVLLRSIVDTAIDGIITIDFGGTIKSFNKAAEEIFGYTAAEAIGQNIGRLMPEPYRSEHGQYIANFLRTGQAKIIGNGREVEGLRKNGQRFPMDLAISEFELDGESGFTGLVRDISTRRELERQYRHAQKMEAVGRLTGGIAHDFNNLLTVILGYCQFLKTKVDASDANYEMVEEIYDAGTKAAMLTRQLLTFSRHQANQPVIVDVNNIVRESVRMISRLIGEDVRVIVNLTADQCSILTDPGHIEQVIVNLSINARDAMPGGGKLTLSTRNERIVDPSAAGDLAPGMYVVLEVADTGEGIPPDIQSKIFEPFFTTKEVGKGTGLGLSVVDGIVRQSNGVLRLTSEPGTGTAFSIFFPVVANDVNDRLPAQTPKPASESKLILLIEEDAAVRELAYRALVTQGYEVVKANDLSHALQFVKSTDRQVGLLLTDAILPDTSGQQLAETVENLHPHVKWLLMSGHNDNVMAKRHRSKVRPTLLQKPYTLESLATAVREAFEK